MQSPMLLGGITYYYIPVMCVARPITTHDHIHITVAEQPAPTADKQDWEGLSE